MKNHLTTSGARLIAAAAPVFAGQAGNHPIELEGAARGRARGIKNRAFALFAGALCLAGAGAMAQEPAVNISPARHPHLAAAQQEGRQAWNKLVEAQKANDWDMQGNAQKAKDLLVQVGQELKLAAVSANKNASNKKPGTGPVGQQPGANISPARHPHLAAAQQLARQAWEKLVEAQKANDWDMDGHAQKAKDLLAQVTQDLKAAAEAANAAGAGKAKGH